MTREEAVARRFWAKVDKSAGPNACWPWTGGRLRCRKYGTFRHPAYSQPQRAHRIAYELTYGAIPDGQHTLHHCDNPPCCNPAHLWLGNNRENSLDAQGKGRLSSYSPKWLTVLDQIRDKHGTPMRYRTVRLPEVVDIALMITAGRRRINPWLIDTVIRRLREEWPELRDLPLDQWKGALDA